MVKNKLLLMKEKKEKAIASLNSLKPVLFYGPPGSGKTDLVLEIAEEQNWVLNRINASDSRTKGKLEQVYSLLRAKPATIRFKRGKTKKQLFFFNEVDGFYDWNFLRKMLVNSQHRIIMDANIFSEKGWGIPRWVFTHPVTKRKFVHTMRFFAFTVEQVKRILREKGYATQLDNLPHNMKLPRDVRAAEMMIKYGSEYELELSDFDQIKAMIKDPAIIGKMVREMGVNRFMKKWNSWLLHNLPIFHRGYNLMAAMELMSAASLYRKPEMLELLPLIIAGSGKQRSEYPNYISVIKKYRNINRKKK